MFYSSFDFFLFSSSILHIRVDHKQRTATVVKRNLKMKMKIF